MFLQVCVCPQGGRVSASVHAEMPYPPPRWRATPPPMENPRMETPPPPEADSSIRSTSGRYASYWNAFLLRYIWSVGRTRRPKIRQCRDHAKFEIMFLLKEIITSHYQLVFKNSLGVCHCMSLDKGILSSTVHIFLGELTKSIITNIAAN